ncbi:MAG: FAD-binding protein [Deltaproteobacteria bacterium]|nr:FAD-binding protein [Deltaproteobacteria bacterium]
MTTFSSSSFDTLLLRLHRRFGARVSNDVDILAKLAVDESMLPKGKPGGVFWPLTTAEVVFTVREATSLNIAIVPRGGGTGKVGGCIAQNGELVIDFSSMNRILEMHQQDLYAVVEPGLINIELDHAAAEHGLMYPPDPASFESCTIGGNIATNAGGARAIKYGTTQRYVWGLTLVKADGEVLQMGRRSIKGVAGYDVTSLIVGSEGTLGLITEAIMHIIPTPPAVETAWLSFENTTTANLAAERIFATGITPRILELLDAPALNAIQHKSEFKIPPAACALLLETDGRDEIAMNELTTACQIAIDHGATDSQIAMSEGDREAMRRARRLVSSALSELFPFKISDDVAVPRSRIPELLNTARGACNKADIEFAAYGHLGDGNIHLNLLCSDAQSRTKADIVRGELLATVVGLGGTITGEHGIGLSKREQLSLEQSTSLIALQKQLKFAFDPKNLINPGKALPDL